MNLISNGLLKELSYQLCAGVRANRWIEEGYFESQTNTQSGSVYRHSGVPVGSSSGRVSVEIEIHDQDQSAAMEWRILLSNRLSDPIHLEWIAVTGLLKTGVITGKDGSYRSSLDHSSSHKTSLPLAPAYFHNGWQSWSFAGWRMLGDPPPRTRLGRFTRPMQEAQGFPSGKSWDEQGHSDMFTFLQIASTGERYHAGYLSQLQAYGRIYLRRVPGGIELTFVSALDGIELGSGQSFTTDWVEIEALGVKDPHFEDSYFQKVGEMNHARTGLPVPVGWCSWYTLFTNVTQLDIEEHLSWSGKNQDRLPLDMIQLDDGFQSKVGDWESRSSHFPQELGALANRIQQGGMIPGLWLAPFLADRRSRLVQDHPDWILKHANGVPVSSGWGWNSFPRVLDITHPEVLEFLANLVQTVTQEWGFEYLKLDFLYAGALAGVYKNPYITRAQAMTIALDTIRDAAGDDVTLIGCGCPQGSGIGVFDGMRVGPDVAPNWHPRLGFLSHLVRHDPGLPAARNAIRNTIARVGFNRRWWLNDPDCVLLRETDSKLSETEVQSLCTAVSMSGGAVIFSDRMVDLSDDRVRWGGRLLPPIEEAPGGVQAGQSGSIYTLSARLQGACGDWLLFGVFNMGDKPETLDPTAILAAQGWRGNVHCVDLWAEKYEQLHLQNLEPWEIAPHAVRCVALRPVKGVPAWLGSTFHLSGGQEVAGWQQSGQEIYARIGFEERCLSGACWIGLPRPLQEATIVDKKISPTVVYPGVYRFNIEFHGVQEVCLLWSEPGK